MAKRLARPELLAPAGDEACLRAAVAAGADAVYFGLSHGFNARARASNFEIADLPRLCDDLHQKGVLGFVTLNTLVFDRELGLMAETLAAVARAGADAVIVQDLGVARLARAVCPELPVHASTQMTVSSAEGASVAATLGVRRIVLPRELSLAEIGAFAKGTDLELECFVHGAMCVSWSGQCLTSEALQARSANRGQCAQSCRLPYELLVDGKHRPLGDVKYLLSPRDLAAYALIPELLAAGVSCFKIEGRMKGPEYVANAVDKYRRALDAAQGLAEQLGAADREELCLTFSRGFGTGFLGGDDHQALVHGRFPGHRGVRVGVVTRVDISKNHVWVKADAAAPSLGGGDRLLFDQGRPEEDEPRGTLYACDVLPGGELKLVFGTHGGLDLHQVRPADPVYKARDAGLTRRLRSLADKPSKLAVDLTVLGRADTPLTVLARDALGRRAKAQSAQALAAASGRALDRAMLTEKLAAFGDSGFELRHLALDLDGALYLSPAELKRLRRELVATLSSQAPPREARVVDLAALERELAESPPQVARAKTSEPPRLVPLLRTLEQVDVALRRRDPLSLTAIALDFMELVGLGAAVDRVRAAGLGVIIATPRVQKPGEEAYDRRLELLAPDGILVRHLGALSHFAARSASSALRLHGDFSLNATNALTARTLLGYGLDTLTPAYDLDLAQLLDLCRGVSPGDLEVTLHQHLPLYHTEHCVYSHLLSQGHDYRTCGRPCEEQRVSLREQNRLEHPVLVDIACRNTVFNARAQSAASCLPELLAAGVRRFRVELVRENARDTEQILLAYAELLSGRRSPERVARDIGALEKYGVSAGTLQVLA